MSHTIALVDDDRNITTSVSILLESEGFAVQIYHDGAEALRGLGEAPVDLAILDIKMPRMDGMELLQNLRRDSVMPVIFLTSKDDEIDEILGLRMGADDYIKKPFSQRLLLERIRTLLRRSEARNTPLAGGAGGVGAGGAGAGGTATGDLPAAAPAAGVAVPAAETASLPASETALTRGSLVLDPARHQVTWKGNNVELTVTEFLILQALALRPGHVKSRDQLIDVAYGEHIYVDDRTIDSHIKRLRKKFRDADEDFSQIETLYGVGYRYKEA